MIQMLVSIIMPAYNCGKYLGQAIESVASQTMKDWEIQLVDDCSTDNTAEIVETYIKKYPVNTQLIALFAVLVVFYVLGSVLVWTLDYFERQNEEKRAEEGEVIEKDSENPEQEAVQEQE